MVCWFESSPGHLNRCKLIIYNGFLFLGLSTVSSLVVCSSLLACVNGMVHRRIPRTGVPMASGACSASDKFNLRRLANTVSRQASYIRRLYSIVKNTERAWCGMVFNRLVAILKRREIFCYKYLQNVFIAKNYVWISAKRQLRGWLDWQNPHRRQDRMFHRRS